MSYDKRLDRFINTINIVIICIIAIVILYIKRYFSKKLILIIKVKLLSRSIKNKRK